MECKNMFDLSGLANNISSQVIILLVILGLVSLVVAVATQGTRNCDSLLNLNFNRVGFSVKRC